VEDKEVKEVKNQNVKRSNVQNSNQRKRSLLDVRSVIGIDLGSDFIRSGFAIVDGGAIKGVRLAENSEGGRSTPTSIGIQETSNSINYILGSSATKQLATYPSLTTSNIRQLLGRKATDPVAQLILNKLKVPYENDLSHGIVLKMAGKR